MTFPILNREINFLCEHTSCIGVQVTVIAISSPCVCRCATAGISRSDFSFQCDMYCAFGLLHVMFFMCVSVFIEHSDFAVLAFATILIQIRNLKRCKWSHLF